MNVVSLSGASGIGTLDVTSGLGPNPQPVQEGRRRRKSGYEAHKAWERAWASVQAEHDRHTLLLIRLTEEWIKTSGALPAESAEDAIAKPLNDADLIMVGALFLATGDDAEVHAPAAGVIRYGVDRTGRKGAVIETPEGARYLIAGLAEAVGDNNRTVDVGDVIGFTPKAGESGAPKRSTDKPTERAVAQLVAGDIDTQIEIKQKSGKLQRYAFDVTGGVHSDPFPTQAEVLLLGTPATLIAFVLGGPVAAIITGSITLVIAASRPKNALPQKVAGVGGGDKLVITAGPAGSTVRAPASGWVSFTESRGDMEAVILSDNGIRYRIVGLALREPLPPPHYVRGGSVIGVTSDGPTDA